MTLQQKTKTAAKWSSLDVFARQGVQFIVSIILARILAPADFGVIAMLAMFIGVAGIFIDGGFSSALIQRQDTSQTDESTVFFFNLAMGTVTALLMCATAPWIADFFNQPVLRYLTYCMAFTLFVNAFSSIHNTLLIKEMDFKTAAKVGVVSSSLAGGVTVFMASQGYGVWSLAVHSIVSCVATASLLWTWHPWRPVWSFDLSTLRSFFRFGGYMMATTIVDVFASNLYLILIGKMYSVNDVGYYDRAKRTQIIPITLMMNILQRVAFSAFSSVAEDKARLVKGLRQAQALSMFVNIPVLLAIIILAEPLVLTLFGSQWRPCVPILQVLGFSSLLWPCHVLNLNVLIAQGRSDLHFRIELLKKSFSISLTVAASFHGIMAIAWAQVILSFFGFFINTYYTKKFLNYSGFKQLGDLAMNFMAAIPMAFAIYFLNALMPASPVINLIVAITVGAVLYFLTCSLLCSELLDMCLIFAGIRGNRILS